MEAKPPAPLGAVLPDVLALEAALVFVEQRQILFRLVQVPHGANYNAQMDYLQTGKPNARSKMAKSETLTLDALTKAVNDNFPNLILQFVEHNNKTNRSYPVDMKFSCVKYIDSERIGQ